MENERKEDGVIAVGPPPKGWAKPLEAEAYHGLAGEMVHKLEPHTEADPVGLLLQFLAGFGNVIGSAPHFRVEADRHGLNLFVAQVGDTGRSRKGTSWGYTQATLAKLDADWASKNVLGGLSSGEGLVKAIEDTQGVVNQDKRVLIFEDEFSAVLRVMARHGNTLGTTLRRAWDGRDLRVLTKRSPQIATGGHVSLIVQTTHEDLRHYLHRVDIWNGFANRFLWACVRRQRLLPFGGRMPEEKLRGLREKLKHSFEFARQRGEVKMSVRAEEAWNDKYAELTADAPGLLGAVTSRAEGQVRRLAAIYALLDGSDTVKTQHLAAALAIWRYCFDSARFLFGGRSASTLEDRLLRILAGAVDGLTRTQISDALHHHAPSEQIGSVLRELREKGLVTSKRRKTRGRSAELWFTAEGGN
jgi:hypothetical protein